jgi:DNA-binding MarR family transcriptional regulator
MTDEYRPAPVEQDPVQDFSEALVIAGDAEGGRAASEALALAEVRVDERIGFDGATAALSAAHGRMIVIEAVGAPDGLVEPVLVQANRVAQEHRLPIVATVDQAQIDLATSLLMSRNARVLSGPSLAERVAAIAAARFGVATAQNVDALSSVMKPRWEDEVARIAETLTRMSRGEYPGSGVRDPGRGYRGEAADGGEDASPREIRTAIRARRMRAQYFEAELFADPAWDMLLDLYASALEGRQVSVSSLCIAAAVPPTTALRWISTLNEAGLFERKADPSDRRRAYIALSAKGLAGMRAYVAALRRQGLPLI